MAEKGIEFTPDTTPPTNADIAEHNQVWGWGSDKKWHLRDTRLVRDRWRDQDARGAGNTYGAWLPIDAGTKQEELPDPSDNITGNSIDDIL